MQSHACLQQEYDLTQQKVFAFLLGFKHWKVNGMKQIWNSKLSGFQKRRCVVCRLKKQQVALNLLPFKQMGDEYKLEEY